MTKVILFAMNLTVIVAIVGVAHLMSWLGPEFAAGCLAGGVFIGAVVKVYGP
jgi:hypothetical protein